MRGGTLLEQLAQDIRYACRSLLKTPAFTAVAIVTFALGIGANTAMFSVINAVMLRPLPFPDPDRLVAVSETDLRRGAGAGGSTSVSWPNYFDWRSRAHVFDHLSAYHETSFTLMVGGRAVHTPGAVVSADLFSTLGVQPALGGGFRLEEERLGSDVVVISDGLWRSEFGANPDVIGSTASIDSRPFTIVGVAPRGFRFPISTPASQLWITVAQDARTETPDDTPMTTQRGAHYIRVIGRMRADASVASVQAELDGIAAALAREYPDDNGSRGVRVTPELDRLVGSTRQPLLVLLVAVACVLLIACVNLANLLLVRDAGRGREIALRFALGASRRRIVAQLLTESATLAACGAAGGLALAYWSLSLLVRLSPAELRGLDEVTIDRAVLAYAGLVAFVSAIGFGTIPALLGGRTEPTAAMQETARATAGRRHSRVRAALVVSETAIGVVLLIAAGLLLRSFYRLAQTDPGFEARRIITARVTLPDARYPYRKQIAFYDDLLRDLGALPGVQASAAAAPLPLNGGRYGISFEQPGVVLPRSQRPSADFAMVSPGYFRAMQIPIVRGRDVSAADDDRAPRVVVVNESFARQFLPGRDPIGQSIRPGLSTTEPEAPWRQIVGVVRDIRQRALNEPARPAYFIPYGQGLISTLFLVIRTPIDPASIVEQTRKVIAAKDPELALYDVRSMEDYVATSMATPRFQTALLTLFAALALALTAVGLYGVVAYGVAQRTREFGIRIALGAHPREVLGLVLRGAMRMAGAGIAAGIIGAAFATRLLTGVLYGVRPLDPVTFVAVSVVLFGVALMASMIPARRATRVDPIQALRTE